MVVPPDYVYVYIYIYIYIRGGFLPVLRPPSPVAAAPDVVVITDDDDEEEDEDDTFRLQRPHPLILSHLYNDDE